jgi:hypothetical protein
MPQCPDERISLVIRRKGVMVSYPDNRTEENKEVDMKMDADMCIATISWRRTLFLFGFIPFDTRELTENVDFNRSKLIQYQNDSVRFDKTSENTMRVRVARSRDINRPDPLAQEGAAEARVATIIAMSVHSRAESRNGLTLERLNRARCD